MKKVLLACVAVLLFMACSKKDIWKWINKPDHPTPPVLCKVDSIYPVEKGDPAAVNWTAVGIHYNDKGNPAVVNYEIQGFSYVDPKFSVYYKYDSKDRLIEVTSPYVDPVDLQNELSRVNKRHKFIYEGNAQLPIRDSIISDTFFGISDGTPYQVFSGRVENLYYDQQGRINKVVTHGWFENTLYDQKTYTDSEVKFSYDDEGNRQVINGNTPSTVSYTDKPSPYSLHPVWQLLHKNWSKNAAMENNVEGYNSYGLPTLVEGQLGQEGFLQTKIGGMGNLLLNITYTCDQDNR